MSTEAILPPKVTFYTKAGCHLCDEARAILDEIATHIDYELTELDIRTSPELFALYRYRIPVILLDATLVAEGRILYTDVAHAFQL